MFKNPRILALFLVFIIGTASFAQSKKDLQKKKEQLKKDIELTNQLLSDTKEKKNTSLTELVTLNKKISIREELISTINDELVDMNHQIAQINMQIDLLSRDLVLLKQEYAKMISYAYKNQSAYRRLMFIFAAKDFNQAYLRLKYLQQYSAFRKKQAALIQDKQMEMNLKVAELVSKKLSKRELLGNQEQEKKVLDNEKGEQLGLLQSLQEKEKQLKKELKEKQRAEENLNKAIEEAVRKEIEEAKRKLEASGRKNVNKKDVFTTAPENIKLSGEFENNKGHLPWPVEHGVITSTFGVHPHPALKGIMVNNNGIDISSPKGSNARTIFDGQITGIVTIPGAYKAVIVRHGDYLSVYSNLEEVFIKMGDKVTTKQNIGKIHTEEDAKTELNIQIWKGETRLDPAEWLMNKK